MHTLPSVHQKGITIFGELNVSKIRVILAMRILSDIAKKRKGEGKTKRFVSLPEAFPRLEEILSLLTYLAQWPKLLQ